MHSKLPLVRTELQKSTNEYCFLITAGQTLSLSHHTASV